jgi:hypothetical protein
MKIRLATLLAVVMLISVGVSNESQTSAKITGVFPVTPATGRAPRTSTLPAGYSSPVSNDPAIDEAELFDPAPSPQEARRADTARAASRRKVKDDAGPADKSKVNGKVNGTVNGKGMTWVHRFSNAQTGTVNVGCSGCDAYKGDTECSKPLPVLCIYKPTPAFPLPVGVNNSDIYNRWAGGVVATTAPVPGNTFADSAAVSAYCKAQFGNGWRVAEFHDGWGWDFQAYGGTVSAPAVPSTRFWVHINDQPAGNCWKQ